MGGRPLDARRGIDQVTKPLADIADDASFDDDAEGDGDSYEPDFEGEEDAPGSPESPSGSPYDEDEAVDFEGSDIDTAATGATEEFEDVAPLVEAIKG